MNTDEARVENDAKAQADQPFEASLESIGSLRKQIEQKKLSLVIPAFQRGYSWREEQVGQLLEDLIDAWQSSHSEPYSLGTIVCTRSTDKNSNELQVLDGQQRLTTIDILLNELSPKEEKDKNRCGELIAAYRYLTAKENADKTRLPRHDLQLKAIRDHLEGVDRARLLKWLKEKKNIQVMLVVLPLKAGAQNEASKMFEIINVQGQQLSLLDQLKSRFLQIFGDAHPLDRSFFNQIWNDCERRLSSYEECVKGPSFDAMKEAMKAAEGSIEEQRRELSLGEMLKEGAPIASVPAEKTEAPVVPASLQLSPIDMLNLLVMANEILKLRMGKGDTYALSRTDAAGSVKDIRSRFDWLVKNNDKEVPATGPENLMRLMFVVSVLARVVGKWAPFRDSKTYDVVGGSKTPLRQLALSFMAANSYQASGQYWLLVLGAFALESGLKNYPLPKEAAQFKQTLLPVFDGKAGGDLEAEALARLVALGFTYARSRPDGSATEIAYKLAVSRTSGKDLLAEAAGEVAEEIDRWRYGDGIRQWPLFFIDWMLWFDCAGSRNTKNRLRELMGEAAGGIPEEKSLMPFKDALIAPQFMNSFENFLRNEFRIVSRGQIDHWFAQETAKAMKERNEISETEFDSLHRLGNLALVDPSTNTKWTDKAPEQRAREMPGNPSPKLKWTAELTVEAANSEGAFDLEIVPAITGIWSRYLTEFRLP